MSLVMGARTNEQSFKRTHIPPKQPPSLLKKCLTSRRWVAAVIYLLLVFLEPDDPVSDYLVVAISKGYEGWFPAGETSLIAGAFGSGKTTWLLMLLLRLRARGFIYGHKVRFKPYKLLLHDRSINAFKRTLRRMHIEESLLENDTIRVPSNDDFAGWSALQFKNGSLAPGTVLLVEGLDMLVPKGEASKFEPVRQFLNALQPTLQQYRATLIGTVGEPKMKPNEKYQLARECIYGNHVWGRMSETVVLIESTEPKDADSIRKLEVIPRNGKSETFYLKFDQNGRLTETDAEGHVVLTLSQRVLQWVRAYIPTGGTFTVKMVSEALNQPDSTIASNVTKLITKGYVEKVKHGVYRLKTIATGKSAVVSLTPLGSSEMK